MKKPLWWCSLWSHIKVKGEYAIYLQGLDKQQLSDKEAVVTVLRWYDSICQELNDSFNIKREFMKHPYEKIQNCLEKNEPYLLLRVRKEEFNYAKQFVINLYLTGLFSSVALKRSNETIFNPKYFKKSDLQNMLVEISAEIEETKQNAKLTVKDKKDIKESNRIADILKNSVSEALGNKTFLVQDNETATGAPIYLNNNKASSSQILETSNHANNSSVKLLNNNSDIYNDSDMGVPIYITNETDVSTEMYSNNSYISGSDPYSNINDTSLPNSYNDNLYNEISPFDSHVSSNPELINYATKVTLDQNYLDNFATITNQSIVGQEKATKQIQKCLIEDMVTYFAPNTNNPISCFWFLGPKGFGKTTLAKLISSYLFNKDEIININLSNYKSQYDLDQLFGLYPDSKNFNSSKNLTQILAENSKQVIVFNEFEKAHPYFWEILYKVVSDGLLNIDNAHLSFKNTIIILASDLGTANESSNHLSNLDNIRKHLDKYCDSNEYALKTRNIIDNNHVILFDKIKTLADVHRILDIWMSKLSVKYAAENKNLIYDKSDLYNNIIGNADYSLGISKVRSVFDTFFYNLQNKLFDYQITSSPSNDPISLIISYDGNNVNINTNQ